MADLLVAVAIKSPIGAKPGARTTLDLLCLRQVNAAVLLKDGPAYQKMLQIAKDYVTWGTVDAEFASAMLQKRGRLPGDKRVGADLAAKAVAGLLEGKTLSEFGIKKYMRFRPPSGGFKRTLKRQISSGGETGNRKEKLKELVERMI